MKVSIVIPNYNGIGLLIKNLPVVAKVFEKYELIVADDASSDGSSDYISRNFPSIKLIKTNKNKGFSSTVNRGVREAEGDLTVLLNTDVVPESNFLKYLLPHFEDPQVFAVGFLQKCPEEGDVILRGRGIGKFEKGFLLHDRGVVNGEDTSESKKTLWVSGGAGIFRKSIWQQLGGLYDLYNPYYWEDIDLSYRAQKAGYKVLFEPACIVVHDQEEGTIKNLYTPEQVKTISYRNQIFFVWLNITDFQFMLNHFICLPYLLFKSIVKGDLFFAKGLLMAILKIPDVLRKRRINKKFAVISDNELLYNFKN